MRHRLALSALLLSLIFSMGGCAYFNTFFHARKFFNQAEKASEEEKKQGGTSTSRSSDLYNKSIEKSVKVLDEHPGSRWVDDAYFLMARSYFGKGDYLGALRELDRLEDRRPDSNLIPEVYYWRGRTHFAQGDYEEARADWNTLLERFPKNDDREDAEFFLAETLRLERRFEEASTAYAAFIEQYSGGQRAVESRISYGSMLMEEKRWEEAQEAFAYVARRAPRQEDRRKARLLLGEAYEGAQEFDQALETYDTLADVLDPNYLKGRMTAEERDALRAAELEALEAARLDSTLNAAFRDSSGSSASGQLTNTQQGDDFLDDQERQDAFGNPVGNQNVDAFGNPVNQATQPGDTSDNQNNRNRQNDQSVTNTVAQQRKAERQALPANDPAFEELARVMLRQGRVLARSGEPMEAILAYEQVIAEYPRTEFAAEAQYRIGYAYEVYLDDYDAAERAYTKVSGQGRSAFNEDAQRRANNLRTVKQLSSAVGDSTAAATQAAAEARFMRAELYIFQQEKPDKAIEEYAAIQAEFPATEQAAKAMLAEAWTRFHVLADSARGRAKYAEVMRKFPDSRYGGEATRFLKGPEREPVAADFAGPSLGILTAPANLAAVAVRDSMLAAADRVARQVIADSLFAIQAAADSAAAIRDAEMAAANPPATADGVGASPGTSGGSLNPANRPPSALDPRGIGGWEDLDPLAPPHGERSPIMGQIQRREIEERRRMLQSRADSLGAVQAPVDSTAVEGLVDTTAVQAMVDTTAVEALVDTTTVQSPVDPTTVQARVDSTGVDSLVVAPPPPETPLAPAEPDSAETPR